MMTKKTPRYNVVVPLFVLMPSYSMVKKLWTILDLCKFLKGAGAPV